MDGLDGVEIEAEGRVVEAQRRVLEALDDLVAVRRVGFTHVLMGDEQRPGSGNLLGSKLLPDAETIGEFGVHSGHPPD